MPKGFSTNARIAAAKRREFSLVSNYKLGYRNREDITNLPPGVLIEGSRNVFTNVSERIQIRKGYALDGPTSSVLAPILASHDWLKANNEEGHLRAGDLTTAGNDGKLQYRYVDSLGAVTWRDLLTGLTSTSFNFTNFWNTTEQEWDVLFVNGASQIQSWNGSVATLASVDNTAGHIASVASAPTAGGSGYTAGDVLTITTGGTGGTVTVLTVNGSGVVQTLSLTSVGSGYVAGTGKATSGGTGTGATINITNVGDGQITVSGTTTIGQLGFRSSANTRIVINGTIYSYTYVFNESFIGISPNATGEAIGSVIHQDVVTVLNSSMTSISSTFKNGLIRTLNNQVFVGALNSPTVYISKVNSYTDYSFSAGARIQGEGGLLVLDANCIAFDPQENFMYISAGQDLWYNVSFSLQTSTVGVTYESVSALPLKTGRRQAAMSQAFVSHMKNNIIVATQETTIDTFGRVETSLATPQQTNISDPIKLDIDSYDFTDGSIFYFRYNLYVAVPKEGLVLVYNLATGSWESPQTLPVSRFYIVNGELYGHSYQTSESYKLFTGYADRVYTGFAGYPIDAVMKFSYENYGSRSTLKSANYLYAEGYISPNTTIIATITYELDGCATTKTFEINGSDTQIVCIPRDAGSLGKSSLGKQKLGGSGSTSIQNLPPKFRAEKSFNNTDFFECSVSFEVLGVDNRMEILAWGLNAMPSSQNPISIRQ